MELIETCFLTSVVKYNKGMPVGRSTRHFSTIDGFRS